MRYEMKIICDICKRPFKTKTFTKKICPKCRKKIEKKENMKG